MEFKLNYKSSPDDNRDYKISMKEDKENILLNANSGIVDLSKYHTSVKNQGSIGSCTAFATVALMEYNRKRAFPDSKDDVYSEKFTYYVTRVNVARGSNADTGAYMRDAFNSARIFGCTFEELSPYDNNYTNKPSDEAYKQALNNQIVTYARLDNVNTSQTLNNIKILLDQGYCFVGGFICYDTIWDDFVTKTGIIPLEGGKIIGGHAVCFVGYDNTKSLLKFKNSWGTGWGDKGYGYLPYSYVLKNRLWDLWTAFTQEYNNTTFDWKNMVKKPVIVQPPPPQPKSRAQINLERLRRK
jgi:C1A family cysteine protease